ncbi:MAG: hypothetical protein ACLFTK_08460 [Anaerolineales bacterium]
MLKRIPYLLLIVVLMALPAAVAAQTSADEIELETYEFDLSSGSVSLQAPAEWTVQAAEGADNVTVASSEDVLMMEGDLTTIELESDESAMTFSFFPIELLGLEEPTAIEAVTVFTELLGNFQTPEVSETNDEIASASVMADGLSGGIYGEVREDTVFFITAFAAPDNAEFIDDLALRLLPEFQMADMMAEDGDTPADAVEGDTTEDTDVRPAPDREEDTGVATAGDDTLIITPGEAADDVTLEPFVTDDNLIATEVPADAQVTFQDSILMITNTENFDMDAVRPELTGDEYGITITPFPLEIAQLMAEDLETDTGAQAVIQTIIQGADATVSLGEVTIVNDEAGRDIALTNVEYENGAGISIVEVTEDGVIIITGISAPDNLNFVRDLALRMLRNTTVTLPEAPTTP